MGKNTRPKSTKSPKDPFHQKRADSLKALKDYCQRASLEENHKHIIDVLMDESDRGAIILVGGVLEDVLAEYILAKLPSGDAHRDELLRRGGVLNSFQDKLCLGLALEVLDEATVDSLDIIRQLRNACAHSKLPVSLKTPAINAVFGLLVDGEVASQNDDYLRFVLGLVMIFHIERIRGKTDDQAQAVVAQVVEDTNRALRAEAKRLASSPETQSEPRAPNDHPDRTS